MLSTFSKYWRGRTNARLDRSQVVCAAVCGMFFLSEPHAAGMCEKTLPSQPAYCSDRAFLRQESMMLALLDKLKENARFDGKEKSAITSQHAIWQRSVRQVCKQNVSCAARAVAGRKSLYEWADRNHTSSLQPIPPADEIASTIRKAIVGIESPARNSGSPTWRRWVFSIASRIRWPSLSRR